MGKITKYHNDLNNVLTRGWTADEMNFFFLIVTLLRDNGASGLELTDSELLGMVPTGGKDTRRRWERFTHLQQNMSKLSFIVRTEDSRTITQEVCHIFDVFRITQDKKTGSFTAFIQVGRAFEYLLNELTVCFTRFEFDEFLSLKGTYAKTMYRLLKQYRTTGWREFTLEEFHYLLSVPDTYRPSHVQSRIIKPCVRALSPYFKDLRIESRKGAGKGGPLIGYRAVWTPETRKIMPPLSEAAQREKEAVRLAVRQGKLPAFYADTGFDPDAFAQQVKGALEGDCTLEDIRRQVGADCPAGSTRQSMLAALDFIETQIHSGMDALQAVDCWRQYEQQQHDRLVEQVLEQTRLLTQETKEKGL